jgi:hypothetical protein
MTIEISDEHQLVGSGGVGNQWEAQPVASFSLFT